MITKTFQKGSHKSSLKQINIFLMLIVISIVFTINGNFNTKVARMLHSAIKFQRNTEGLSISWQFLNTINTNLRPSGLNASFCNQILTKHRSPE